MDLSGFNVWRFIAITSILLLSMLVANILKRKVKFLKNSLIPTSVLGGLLILVVTTVYQAITGEVMFDALCFTAFNSKTFEEHPEIVSMASSHVLSGSNVLEAITYHCLALGFIATSFGSKGGKVTKERAREVFDSGVTTVSTYLVQALLGLVLTFLIYKFVKSDMFPAAGALLCFGFGQGTGQAYNYGNIYENIDPATTQCGFAFSGGSNFGLAVAALGFLSACLGGVIYLNIMKKKGRLVLGNQNTSTATVGDFQEENEIPLSESMDKFTVQVAVVLLTYGFTYLLLYGLSKLVPGMTSTIFGFNFLFGVLVATAVKAMINLLTNKGIVHRQYVNKYLMNRLGGFFFDLMVVAGIAAINLYDLAQYWWILLLMCGLGMVATFGYNVFVARKLFKGYSDEQFLVMYGMLTGTASTGVILLREADPNFSTPASSNLVYQQFIAIVFGFPMMLLATFAPKNPLLTIGIVALYLIVLVLILFRNLLFKRKQKPTEHNS